MAVLIGMSAEEFRDFLFRHRLRQVDGAWLCGLGGRTGRNWVKQGVPISCALILKAYDEGKLPLQWFADNVPIPVPD